MPGLSLIPPILHLDAFWATVVRPNGWVRQDGKGRRRSAMGHRCSSPWGCGRTATIARFWRGAWGQSESSEEWSRFLEILEAQGIRGENRLKPIIHDGGAGLGAAWEMVWFNACQQRYLFHNLRNISRAIRLPDDLSDQERRRFGRRILRDFRSIWEARRYDTMLRCYLQVVRTYRHDEPEAVATLRPSGALPSPTPPTGPRGQRLSLRNGGHGHDRPGGPPIPCR